MSQAEHDVLASAILLTTSERIARETVSALKEQVRSLSRRKIIEQSLLDYGAVIICRTLDEAIGFANDLRPSIWSCVWKTRWNTSAGLITPARFFSATIHRNRWAIITQGRTMFCPRAGRRAFSPRWGWTAS